MSLCDGAGNTVGDAKGLDGLVADCSMVLTAAATNLGSASEKGRPLHWGEEMLTNEEVRFCGD